MDEEEPMRAPAARTNVKHAWERTICRYLSGYNIPLSFLSPMQGFRGIYGFTFRRIVPKRRGDDPGAIRWERIPKFMRDHNDEPNLILFVTNPTYCDSIEDVIVVMRLGTFGPLFASHINTDRERYVHAAQHHG
jgi:hypothetical protein